MASIIKRKSKYSVIYSYDDENGEKRQKWETWGTLRNAKQRLSTSNPRTPLSVQASRRFPTSCTTS